jgi:hypothetical protein
MSFDNIIKNELSPANYDSTSEEQVLAIGRYAGVMKVSDNGEKKFFIGSTASYAEANEIQANLWIDLRQCSSIEEWEERNKDRVSTTELEETLSFFLNHFLVIPLNYFSLSDSIFKNVLVTRNGLYSKVKEDGDWEIFGFNSKEVAIMSESSHRIWRLANGVSTLEDIILEYMKENQCSEANAIQHIRQIAPLMQRKGFWNLEWAGNLDNLYLSTELYKEFMNHSIFNMPSDGKQNRYISLGIQNRYPTSKQSPKISVGEFQKPVQTLAEYNIWLLSRQGAESITKYSELLKSNIIAEETVRKLLEQRLLMVWSEQILDFGHAICACAQGLSFGTEDNNEFIMKAAVSLNIKVPKVPYLIWLLSQGFVPLNNIIRDLAYLLRVSIKESEKYVHVWIPILMQQGLLHLQVIPTNNK